MLAAAQGRALVVVKMHVGAHDVGRTLRPAESAPTCSHHRTPCPKHTPRGVRGVRGVGWGFGGDGRGAQPAEPAPSQAGIARLLGAGEAKERSRCRLMV